MQSYEVLEYSQLDGKQRESLVDIFIEGFGHLMTFTKDKGVLKKLYETAFHESYMLAYVENNEVLGLLGIATNCTRPIKLVESTCVDYLGNFKGRLISHQMNSIFQSQVVKLDTELYVDVLATSAKARKKGVATKLLNYAFSLPNYEMVYIEVLSKNLNAKRLYEKVGFISYKESPFSLIRLLGSGYPIKMKYDKSSYV